MKTTQKESNNFYNINDVINFPSNEIHIVCPALKKGSICSHLLFNNCNMGIAEIGKLCDLVNYNKTSGCLYPKFRITLFPIYDVIRDTNLDDKIKKIIADIIESNEVYLKAKKIVFIVDDMNWPNPLDLKDAFDEISKERIGFKYLEEVVFYNYQ